MDEKTANALADWLANLPRDFTRLRIRTKKLQEFGDTYGVEVYVDGRRTWTVMTATRKKT